MSDLVKRLRLGACALEIEQAADRIEELTAQLAEVTEERDALRMQSTDLINDTVSTGMARDEALNQLDSERYSVEVLERRIRELLPRAYQMGLDAGRDELLPVLEGLVGPHWSDAWYGDEKTDKPQPLTPPADLVEQCKKETSHDSRT